MVGRKPGPPPGKRYGGRQKGTRNKATVEREHKAIEIIQKGMPAVRALAKEQLAELVPVVKGIVARYQMAAMASGAPGDAGYKPEFWRDLRDWIKTYAAVADLAADFESPRFRAIVVAEGTGGVGAPFVIRAPAVMIDSTEWQNSVGAAVLDMEAAQAASRPRPEVLAPTPASDTQIQQNAPVTSPVVLTTDPETRRITAMPAVPVVAKPVGTEEWLAGVMAERRKAAG